MSVLTMGILDEVGLSYIASVAQGSKMKIDRSRLVQDVNVASISLIGTSLVSSCNNYYPIK